MSKMPIYTSDELEHRALQGESFRKALDEQHKRRLTENNTEIAKEYLRTRRYDDLEELLEEDPDIVKNDELLYQAIVYGRMETVKMLVKYGAYKSLSDRAVVLAMQRGHYDIVDYLVSLGVKYSSEFTKLPTPFSEYILRSIRMHERETITTSDRLMHGLLLDLDLYSSHYKSMSESDRMATLRFIQAQLSEHRISAIQLHRYDVVKFVADMQVTRNIKLPDYRR